MSTALNAPIPSFDALTATSGTTVSSETLKGQFSVLYFYPKDSTPGCTTESQDFTRLFDEFQALNCQIFGVSRDSVKSHENFKARKTVKIQPWFHENMMHHDVTFAKLAFSDNFVSPTI